MRLKLLEDCKVRSRLLAGLLVVAREAENCISSTGKGFGGKRIVSSKVRIYRHREYSTCTRTQNDKFKEAPRINPVGIQYLSESLHKQLFGNEKNNGNDQSLSEEKRNALVNLSKQTLKNFNLLGKKTCISEPISMDLPKLQGESLDEHFQKLGHFASEPYKTMATNKFTRIVARPSKWERIAGWTRYEPGKKPQNVSSPCEETLVFDVETLYKVSHFPTMAVALSNRAWYVWCSPYICESDSPEHLIPMGAIDETRLIVGHNVAYDRARVLEEYNLKASNSFYIDTQSLHIASSGLCSRQRPRFMKTKKYLGYDSDDKGNKNNGKFKSDIEATDLDESKSITQDLEEDPWLNVSAMNSLHDVAFFHCGIRINKEPRDLFRSENRSVIIDNFQELVNYCSTDVEATSKVFDKVFPLFLEKCPHPVSFGALRFLSSCILPTRYTEWNDYINRSERIYQDSKKKIEDKIIKIIQETVKLCDNQRTLQKAKKDPWLRQLDWTIKPLKITKRGVPAKNQKLPGLPEWYRSLFPNKEAKTPIISIKSRNIPLFFRLSWEGFPCTWTDLDGWCFPVPTDCIEKYKDRNYILAGKEANELFLKDLNEIDPLADLNQVLFKIPHPSSPHANCTTLLSKPYIHFFEKKILHSESELADEALQINSSGSYWMSSRERILSQFVVPQRRLPDQFESSSNCRLDEKHKKDLGLIIPGIIPMGTVTRRAVEKTWLTASNAKKNRVGSELKAQIKAPNGYCFVGADVDSEELWIASLVGDSVFNIHGGTPIGWMCLEGTKNEGTDLHTKTAEILGCTRNEAKIFNYGRIYGAGEKFAAQLLKSFNHSLTTEGAKEISRKLYESTKGKVKRSKLFKKFWYGGSESILFNKLESIAEQEEPRTPVLGCGITASLLKKNLGTNSFLPSRINWAIQSSGVDYLHLLVCSMHYLISKYEIDARLCISIHDEIRYLVAEEDKYRAAMALQISNIWTRAIFSEQMGINDLPQNCAFFSAVDIDHVLRKEVDMDCITPSNSVPIPHGESLNINQLLDKPDSFLTEENKIVDVSKFPFHLREPVFIKYNQAHKEDFLDYFLKMQVQTSKWKVQTLESEYKRKETAQKFQKDNLYTTFGFLDYLKGTQEVKKAELLTKQPRSITSFVDKTKQSGEASFHYIQNFSTEAPDNELNSFNKHITRPGAFTYTDRLNQTAIIEELHMSNAKESSNLVSSEIDQVANMEGTSKSGTISEVAGHLGRRKTGKVSVGQKAYTEFYESLDNKREHTSNKTAYRHKVSINDVLDDVLNDSDDQIVRNKSVKQKARRKSKRSNSSKRQTTKVSDNENEIPVAFKREHFIPLDDGFIGKL